MGQTGPQNAAPARQGAERLNPGGSQPARPQAEADSASGPGKDEAPAGLPMRTNWKAELPAEELPAARAAESAPPPPTYTPLPARPRTESGAPFESRPRAAEPAEPGATSPTRPGEEARRVLPRMELKPILPVDPQRSNVNVIPVPRIPAPPPPASVADGGIPAERVGRAVPLPQPSSAPAQAPKAGDPPDLQTVLERLVDLPAQTSILGVCDDRLPVLLDLNDPAPGALLVASDDAELRRGLLRTLLQTAAALNSPRSVQFLVLSAQAAEWQSWLEGLDAIRHCLGVDNLLEGNADRWLLKLAGWADQRRTGSASGPAVILVVDDLELVPRLEYDARVNFDWLVKEGPGVRIWPVAGAATAATPDLARWVRLFKTRILGPADDSSLLRQLAGAEPEDSEACVQPGQFAVRIQESWLKFNLPAVGS